MQTCRPLDNAKTLIYSLVWGQYDVQFQRNNILTFKINCLHYAFRVKDAKLYSKLYSTLQAMQMDFDELDYDEDWGTPKYKISGPKDAPTYPDR